MIENVSHPNMSERQVPFMDRIWWVAVGRMIEKNIDSKLCPWKGGAVEPVSGLLGSGGMFGLEAPNLM